jgi:hypothetical protein
MPAGISALVATINGYERAISHQMNHFNESLLLDQGISSSLIHFMQTDSLLLSQANVMQD